MAIKRVDFSGNPTAALVNLDANDVDLDTRVTAAASAAAAAQTSANSAQATANAALPLAGGMLSGSLGITASGNAAVLCESTDNALMGIRLLVPSSSQGIGGPFTNFGNLGTAVQVDAYSTSSAYQIVRATRWNGRHLAGIDIYEGGSTTSHPQIAFNCGSTSNAFNFAEGGNALFAGTLTQN